MARKKWAKIADLQSNQLQELKRIRIIDSMNSWVGSWFFLFFHVIWFTLWLMMSWDIDMLTMIVSLEAIVLMILLLMSQNRQGIKDDLRDEADYQADINSLKTAQKILDEVKEIKEEIKELKKTKK
ncbi:MAG: DUF1003 domain-containing protein [Patescibacteria group bacterium]|jgi:uncharacterized membrane protein